MYYRLAIYNHCAPAVHGRQSTAVQNHDPWPPTGMEKPSLPEDYHSLSPEEGPG